MKAIETEYAGCRFRSRLEARWAVFFDAAGVEWAYEVEGYELPSGRYLPDFWLPDIGFYEVKGQKPTDDEDRKASELAELTGKRVFTAWGGIPFDVNETGYQEGDTSAGFHRDIRLDGGMDFNYAWCRCPWCGRIGIEYEGRGARVCGYKSHFDTAEEAWSNTDRTKHWRVDDKCYTADDHDLHLAFVAARSARFEFGETPTR